MEENAQSHFALLWIALIAQVHPESRTALQEGLALGGSVR
jgi:hypothetical protein